MMMTRRYNGALHEMASPSKEEVRKRLFVTPQKPIKSKHNADLGTLPLSRSMIASFVCFAILVLVGVHGYLLHALFSHRVGPASSPDHASVATQTSTSTLLRSSNRRKQIAKRPLQSLQEKDWTQYTIRINTWRRPEQLIVAVDWYSRCPGVAQIQVVWCDKENEPPPELADYDKAIIERHELNTLNERFNILIPPPTLGILSIDDDVLRPCEAIDAGFFKWTESPDRMVGFDGRLHVENDDGSWKYGYMSTTEKANRYSMSLTRCCFVHRDYMDIYMKELPQSILDSVATNFNCEDVAMSFLISSLTDGKPPLLADTWAIKSMVKLFVEEKISGGQNHKHLRDVCVDSFGEILGLKDEAGSRRLKSGKLYHTKDSFFDCGDTPHHRIKRDPKSERQKLFEAKRRAWHEMGKTKMQKDIRKLMWAAGAMAYQRGLVEKTDIWKERFHH